MRVSASTLRLYAVTAIFAAVLAMSAATTVGQQSVEGFTISGASQQRISEVETRFAGGVTLQRDDMTVVADNMTLFSDRGVAVATGHVVFRRGENRVNSESATFSLKTQLGTFVRAYGVFAAKPETSVYFYGETVEQTDGKTYRVANGGFIASTQPIPTWQLTSAAMVFSVR